MQDKDLKMETKCYDASEYGYLYGLNKRIPDDEFEKVKSYMVDFEKSLINELKLVFDKSFAVGCWMLFSL